MKKKIIFSALIIFLSVNLFSQTNNWQWARKAGGSNWDAARSVASDNSGNVFIAGFFDSPAITFGPTTLTGNTSGDMFIAKYDSLGNALWAKSAWGYWHDEATSVITDRSGNVYVAGWFSSPYILIESDTLNNANASADDIFLMKFSTTGNLLWAKRFGGNSHDAAYSLVSDEQNNIYMAGFFGSPTITFGAVTLINSGGLNTFLTKLDSSGNVIWAKNAVGPGNNVPHSIYVDASDNAYVVGDFTSQAITFDSLTLLNSYAAPTTLMYFVKYDSLGNVQWAKSAGNHSGSTAKSVAGDSSGKIYVAGTFGDTLVLENDTLVHSDTTGVHYSSNIFISKYDGNGNKLWVKRAGGNFFNYVTSVAVDNSFNIFLTGYYVSSKTIVQDSSTSSIDTLATYAIFGNDTLLNQAYCSTPNNDIFLANYDSSGNVLWSERIGGCSDDYAQSLTVNSLGDVYMTGWFGDTIKIGSTVLTGNESDLFLAKLNSPSVGINEPITNDNSISIYPNPSSANVNINLNKEAEYSVQVCDMLGEILYETDVKGTAFSLEISSLPKGIYFITIMDKKNNCFTKKFVMM